MPKNVLDEYDEIKIRDLYSKGSSINEIALSYHVSDVRIRFLCADLITRNGVKAYTEKQVKKMKTIYHSNIPVHAMLAMLETKDLKVEYIPSNKKRVSEENNTVGKIDRATEKLTRSIIFMKNLKIGDKVRIKYLDKAADRNDITSGIVIENNTIFIRIQDAKRSHRKKFITYNDINSTDFAIMKEV